MFSHAYDAFVAWISRTISAQHEVVIAWLFLVFLFATGTAGYMLIEQWTWTDGLYMTFITLSTIGFAEVRELSTAGRIFTIVIALAGIGSVAFIATRTAQLLLAREGIRQRQIKRMINRLENHYLICGYGRIGHYIAQDLEQEGVPFVIIDHNEEKIERLTSETKMLGITGNAEEEATLRAAGIDRASGLILTLPDDSANVFVTLSARELNPSIFILARTDVQANRRKLLRAGADKVIAPYEIGADRMAQVILRPNVDRFMEQVLHTGALDLQMEEVVVEAGAPLAGKSLAESQFRQHFAAMVIALLDQKTGDMMFNPDPKATISAGDILIVLGSKEMIQRLRDEGSRRLS